MRRSILIAAALLVAGCNPPVRLSPEASLVRSKCGACHPRPEPGDDAVAAWVTVRGFHEERLGLSADDSEKIRAHLEGRVPATAPLPQAVIHPPPRTRSPE
jgi:hypothetical protein